MTSRGPHESQMPPLNKLGVDLEFDLEDNVQGQSKVNLRFCKQKEVFIFNPRLTEEKNSTLVDFNFDFQGHLKLDFIFFKWKLLVLTLDFEKTENFVISMG